MKEFPVIIMSAKTSVEDKVSLLLGGAADYITKPFYTKELLARIIVALRIAPASVITTLTFSDIEMCIRDRYYAEKDKITRIRQKSSDLRRIVQTALERNRKKFDLQTRQMKDTEKMEKYKVYGELINTYGYNLESGCKSFQALNYYTNEEITIRCV